jgi:predicted transcriptional regulator
VLQTLLALSKLPSPGPASVSSHIHVCSAVLTIGDEGPIGRIELSRKLALGEGAVRTIIKRLTQAKFVTTVKDGCILTKTGMSVYKRMRNKFSKVSIIDAKQLTLDKVSAAIVIREAGPKVKRGIEQRDAAIRAGATGACTLVVRGGEYIMPMGETEDWRLEPRDPLAQDLRNAFHPENGDVIAIVSASREDLAEHGAVAVALTLLE